MMCVIIVVGVVVGIATDKDLSEADSYHTFASWWEPVITLIFLFELLMKVR
jgi:hypothetical protein